MPVRASHIPRANERMALQNMRPGRCVAPANASSGQQDYCQHVSEGLDREATGRPHVLHHRGRPNSIEDRYSNKALSGLKMSRLQKFIEYGDFGEPPGRDAY